MLWPWPDQVTKMVDSSFRFKSFTLDLGRLCLRGPLGQVDLRRKSFEVLRYLVEHAGRVLTKEDVIKAVWPDVTVSDESLTQCISEVRRALDDKDHQIIKTIPRRGYLMDVSISTGGETALAPPHAIKTKEAPKADLKESLERVAERDPEEALATFDLKLITQAVHRYEGTAQQAGMPVIGFLSPLGRNDRPELTDGFRRGLSESGYVEGRNVAIEYRFAENQYDRLPALATDLVGRKAAVILAAGGGNSALAAKTSTSTIPIVFLTGGDPVQEGIVSSLNRPAGNVTGINFFGTQLGAKGLELLHELVPNSGVIALLVNPKARETARTQSDAQEAARRLGRQLLVLNASTPSEIDITFVNMRQGRVGAVLVGGDPFFSSRRQQIVALATRDAIPSMYFSREYVAEGGLMSYGNNVSDAYRRAGVYVGWILKGQKPADLPVNQATKFELVINLKTAKALGVTVPDSLLACADEVIE